MEIITTCIQRKYRNEMWEGQEVHKKRKYMWKRNELIDDVNDGTK